MQLAATLAVVCFTPAGVWVLPLKVLKAGLDDSYALEQAVTYVADPQY